MDLEIVSTESWAPASAVDVRNNLRIGSAAEDTLIADFVASAARHVERRTKTSIRGRVLRMFLPAWPKEYVELPAPPLRYTSTPESAVTIEHLAEGGSWTNTAADVLRLERASQVWVLRPGQTPAPALADAARAVRISFTVGYGSAALFKEAAPDLFDALLLLASHRYANREATANEARVLNVSRKIENGFEDLIRPHIVATRYMPVWA